MANFGYIQVTRTCNQECIFCSNPPIERLISFARAKKIIDHYKKIGYEGIIWTGGEPTLHPRLKDMIAYAKKKGIHSRLITNGQKTASLQYLRSLVDAGIDKVEVSLHSHMASVQNYLSQNKRSFANIVKTLENLDTLHIPTEIITVINKKNAGHLSKTVSWIIGRFPFVNHFVFNNIDPLMNRAAKNTFIIPRLNDFELELKKALDILRASGRTFRVERVPLCYMVEHAHCSTEARKIVKKEERSVHFLDKKGNVRQTQWKYGKAECCRACQLSAICPGLWQMDAYYSAAELYPVFCDPKKIKKMILSNIE
jgi:MoaA/NifB/PqqE/SkfB family radical SAM enzyme